MPCIGATTFPPPPPLLAATARGLGFDFLAPPPAAGAASAPSGRNSFTSNLRPFTSTGTLVAVLSPPRSGRRSSRHRT